ncbi:hypothetical protein AWB66_06210 [Caballeronia telluris]|uniref:Uncharacterized protein n=1 Tax=Caballeronia telluris TaxID=326475 RepID=A0A158KHJ8_9BURK|nr:hypothetical protein AWB66_06210 [Caballeronia telluris]
MGKVVPLVAGHRRKSPPSPSVTQDTGAPQQTPVCRRLVRAIKNVALALLRALGIGLVDVLLSMLLFLARPARVVFKLGIIGLLLILVMEGMNHWRDSRLCIIAVGAILGLILALGVCKSLIICLTIHRDKSAGS